MPCIFYIILQLTFLVIWCRFCYQFADTNNDIVWTGILYKSRIYSHSDLKTLVVFPVLPLFRAQTLQRQGRRVADIHSILLISRHRVPLCLKCQWYSQLLSCSYWDCPSMLMFPFPVLNCFLVLLRLDIEMRDGLSRLPHDWWGGEVSSCWDERKLITSDACVG